MIVDIIGFFIVQLGLLGWFAFLITKDKDLYPLISIGIGWAWGMAFVAFLKVLKN